MSVILLGSHEVKDYEAWKAGFDAHEGERQKAGFKQLFVGRDATKPNFVHVGFQVASADVAKGFIADPSTKETMRAAGVLGTPEFRIVVT